MVANPRGSIPQTIFAWDVGSSAYQPIPSRTPLKIGVGYWAYFGQPAVVDISKDCTGGSERPDRPCVPPSVSIDLPSGEFVLVGNPDPFLAFAEGADVVYTYDPTTQQYVEGNVLQMGQGAWAYSSAGGSLTFAPAVPYPLPSGVPSNAAQRAP